MKRIISILMLLVLALTLCGCTINIDDMKKMHAVYTEDGNIVYENKIYKQLPASEYLDPPYNEYVPYINVTDSDVPLLLSERIGDSGTLSKDKSLIRLDYNPYTDSNYFYCIESEYDKFYSYIMSDDGVGDTYCYDCSYTENGEYVFKNYLLTESQSALIKELLKGEKISVDVNFGNEMFLYLTECSYDLNFKYGDVRVYKQDGLYYVGNAEEHNGFIDVCPVPDKYNAELDGIVKAYQDSILHQDMEIDDNYKEYGSFKPQ